MTKALLGKVAVDGSWIILNKVKWRYAWFALSRGAYPYVTCHSFTAVCSVEFD